MKSVAFLFIHLLVLIAKSLPSGGIKATIAENLLLKQQLIELSRSRRKAPNLKTSDRFILGGLSLFISTRRRLTAAVIIKPSTLLKFHRALVKRKDSLWSIVLFRSESLTLKTYWILVVMDQYSRRIIGFGIHQGDVDGIALCRMFNHAVSGSDPPRYFSSDVTTTTVRTQRSPGFHQRNSANKPTRHSSISTTRVGNNIAADYSTRQFLREYQFATYRRDPTTPLTAVGERTVGPLVQH